MELSGVIAGVTFYNEENGYAVLRVEAQEGADLPMGVEEVFHAVGTLPLPSVGESIAFEGEWVDHPRFGTQLKFTAATPVLPDTLEGMENYLASGIVYGIGPATAKSILLAFGGKAFEVLSSSPEQLASIKGVSLVKAHKMVESFNEQQDGRAAIIQLQNMGLSAAQGIRLYRLYGNASVNVVGTNPYQLIEDVEGIGFKTADKIARAAGIGEDSPFRIAAGIKFALGWAGQEGYTGLPKERLIDGAAREVLEVDPERIATVLGDMLLRSELIVKEIGGEEIIFTPFMHRCESSAARVLLEHATAQNELLPLDYAGALARFEREKGIVLEGQQREAVMKAVDHNVLVITGGPGTGKTTIIKFILLLYGMAGVETLLCAPTGRAAKRLFEATGHEASTIHRLLEFTPDGYFSRNEDNPLKGDAVIVDETSMVDAPLLYALTRALPENAKLILVGDADQLPSVGPGNVLQDIIASETVQTIRLTEIFRQAKKSGIVINAHRINTGQPLEYDYQDFELVETSDIRSCVVDMALKGEFGDFFGDVQVLTPLRSRGLGAAQLNVALQQALNPPSPRKEEQLIRGTLFRDGDKVMQVKNNYQLEWSRSDGRERGIGVFNGDMGTIMHIYAEDRMAEVLFDDERMAFYDFSQMDELELAYAITIHKSQGSEFGTMVLCIGHVPRPMLSRNLLYTAVTRAKKRVVILGRRATVQAMADAERDAERVTGLAHFLRSLAPMYGVEV